MSSHCAAWLFEPRQFVNVPGPLKYTAPPLNWITRVGRRKVSFHFFFDCCHLQNNCLAYRCIVAGKCATLEGARVSIQRKSSTL
jgi:hypothetical protein